MGFPEFCRLRGHTGHPISRRDGRREFADIRWFSASVLIRPASLGQLVLVLLNVFVDTVFVRENTGCAQIERLSHCGLLVERKIFSFHQLMLVGMMVAAVASNYSYYAT